MAPNYALSKVYVIRNTINEKLYVGSTTRTLAQRMTQHRCYYNKGRNTKFPLYEAMNELGVEHFYIELWKDAPCERKEQLHKCEGDAIRELKTIVPEGYNSRVAGRKYSESKIFL